MMNLILISGLNSARLSKEIYSKLLNNSMKQNKYKNKKVEYHGIKFDSKKERDYYIVLEMMLKNKQITDLKTQVKFELQPSFKFKGKTIRSINYIADFTYTKDGQLVIVDTKGYKTEVYKLKKKLMQFKGYDIKEI